MTLQQIIYKSDRPYPWHPLSVSLSLFAIVAVGIGWCWKEYSKQWNYSNGFQREFYRPGHACIVEGCLSDRVILRFAVIAFFDADC